MKKYTVYIQRDIAYNQTGEYEVVAESREEAYKKAEEAAKEGKVIFDEDYDHSYIIPDSIEAYDAELVE